MDPPPQLGKRSAEHLKPPPAPKKQAIGHNHTTPDIDGDSSLGPPSGTLSHTYAEENNHHEIDLTDDSPTESDEESPVYSSNIVHDPTIPSPTSNSTTPASASFTQSLGQLDSTTDQDHAAQLIEADPDVEDPEEIDALLLDDSENEAFLQNELELMSSYQSQGSEDVIDLDHYEPALPLPPTAPSLFSRPNNNHAANHLSHHGSSNLHPNVPAGPPSNIKPINLDDIVEPNALSYNDLKDTGEVVFTPYKPKYMEIHCEHPAKIVESTTLGGAELPPLEYVPRLPDCCLKLKDKSTLSAVQLETVRYVGQRHQILLESSNGGKERAGYFIGDGTGVGKGRQIAAIITDNFMQGRTKAVWMTASNSLIRDSQRDISDIGMPDLEVFPLPASVSDSISQHEGVLFVTYSMMIGRGARKTTRTRYQQILEWITKDVSANQFDGVIVFDEAHFAKTMNFQNASAKGKTTTNAAGGLQIKKSSSMTAQLVNQLQHDLPMARVVYVSATGASDPKHMAYMTRLGLWGGATCFSNFKQFVTSIGESMAAMEMVAMEMKSLGMYCSRHLSYEGTKFDIHQLALDAAQRKMYNSAAAWWQRLIVDLEEQYANGRYVGAGCIDMRDEQVRKMGPSILYSTHQRFFLQLCIAVKVKETLKIAEQALKENQAVVIGLFSTGESALDEQLSVSKFHAELLSAPRLFVENFLKKWFPVYERTPYLDLTTPSMNGAPPLFSTGAGSTPAPKRRGRPANTTASPHTTAPPFLINPRQQQMLQRYLKELSEIELPDNPIDQLIDQLGGIDHVAEITGRLKRLVRRKPGEQTSSAQAKKPRARKKRATANKKQVDVSDDEDDSDSDAEVEPEDEETLAQLGQEFRVDKRKPKQDNNIECNAFMNGKKNVAIISEAASVGISLHSALSSKNQKRRIHIVLQLPWSAEKAVQQLGRTHRSYQANAPHYKLLITELGGERRLASVVGTRLSSLGALTSGDRRAASSVEALSEFVISGKYGSRAVQRLSDSLDAMSADSQTTYSTNPMAQSTRVAQMEMLRRAQTLGALTSGTLKSSDRVKRFLNRLLGLSVEDQLHLFSMFIEFYDASINKAKADGKYDDGIYDIVGNATVFKELVYTHPSNPRQQTFRYDLVVANGVSWDDAIEILRCANAAQNLSAAGSYRRSNFPNVHNRFYESKHTRAVLLAVQVDDEQNKFHIILPSGRTAKPRDYSDLKDRNREITNEAARARWEQQYEEHVKKKSGGSGRKNNKTIIISGSILPTFEILRNHSTSNKKRSQKISIVRAKCSYNGKFSRVVGLLVPPQNIDDLINSLAEQQQKLFEKRQLSEIKENIDPALIRGFTDSALAKIECYVYSAFLKDQNQPYFNLEMAIADLSNYLQRKREISDLFFARDKNITRFEEFCAKEPVNNYLSTGSTKQPITTLIDTFLQCTYPLTMSSTTTINNNTTNNKSFPSPSPYFSYSNNSNNVNGNSNYNNKPY